jgi:YaaC-like Protein
MTRYAPPGHAARGERKEVYSAAMEQAEQFLTASDDIGYEIKPILLYYGFNQMLRAVAAVCYQPRDNWKFGHHGLSCRNLDQIKYLHDVQVEEEGKGAVQVLAELFGIANAGQ